jgi:hypothetical protein
MKYYAACVDDTGINAACLLPPKQILLSYHYYKKKPEKIKDLLNQQYDIFLDSGAFSAMNAGKQIDIDAYCNYIKETGVTYYATLDVIGNAKATLENHKYMINEYGLNPIVAFHMGSKIEELEPLMEYNYIALGGLVFSSGIMNHCDEVWHYILTNKPDLKVHGFGLTNIELMKRYPWYSVDSSSFQGCRRFGRQNILWNGFDFKTLTEDDFLNLLEDGFKYDKKELKEDNKKRIYLEDLFAVNSIKQYASHLHELNKYRDFKHLTQQTKLF